MFIFSRILGLVLIFLAVGSLILAKVSYFPEEPRSEFMEEYTYPDSQFIEVDGMKVHYLIRGEGENLVLLHGQGGNIHHFDAMLPELVKQYRVISLDYMGHGLTGADPKLDYSNEHFISFFEKFFEQLDIQEMHLVGNSMGGYWSMLYALKYPERVKSLSLLNSFGGRSVVKGSSLCINSEKSSDEFSPEDLPFADSLSRWFLPKFLVKSELKKMFYQSGQPTDKVVSLHHDMFSVKGNRIYRQLFDQYDRPTEAIDSNPPSTPSLVLWGSEDQILELCEGENLHKRLPNSQLLVLDNIGHLPMIEAPKETTDALVKFLSEFKL